MENLSLMLMKQGTAFQAWVVRIFQAVFTVPKRSEPRITLKDLVLGVVGRHVDDGLADQIVYLAEHSTVLLAYFRIFSFSFITISSLFSFMCDG